MTFKTSLSSRRHKGLALIVALTIMALIATLGVAIIALTRNKTASSQALNPESIARSNARMALNLAVAKLQRDLGPDQRVSAYATIFDANPRTLEIDDVANPWVVGAWSTLDDNNEPIIYRDRRSDRALDKRNPRDRSRFDHRENVLSWLVSNPGDGSFDPRTTTLTPGQTGATLGSYEGNPILAPLVPTASVQGDPPDGAYAYHIKDLGVAAPLVQHNPNVNASPNPNNPADGGYANLYVGSKRPYEAMSETAAALGDLGANELVQNYQQVSNFISPSSIQISPNGGTSSEALNLLRNFSMDFTDTSSALFTDTLNGGLKVDLTPYIRQAGPAGTGTLQGSGGLNLDPNASGNTILTDTTPIIPFQLAQFQNFSPKFGILRDHAQLGNLVSTDRTIAPRPPSMGSGYLSGYPSVNEMIQRGIHPYICEYSVYTRPVLEQASPSNIALLVYPRITLWNPFNVAIEGGNYFVQINMRSTLVVETPNTTTNSEGEEVFTRYGWTGSYWGGWLGGDPAKARNEYMFFYVEPFRMEPGQAVVLTPRDPYREFQWRDENVGQNVLTPFGDPANLHCFYANMGGPEIDPSEDDMRYRFLRYWQNGYHIGYDDSTSCRLRLVDRIGSPYAQVINQPIVHTMDIMNWKRGNEGRWRDINRPWLPILNSSTSRTTPPDNRTKLGIRFKAFQETPENVGNTRNGYWNFPFFENSNLHAGIYRRHPWDWIQGNPTALHEFTYGIFAGEDSEQPGYLEPFMRPRFVNGVAETSPFMNSAAYPGDLRFTIFDIPPAGMEFFNIGQFRNAALTQEFSAPTYIIGESHVPVNAPRESSAFDSREYPNQWWGGLNQGRVTSLATWWDNSYDPNRNLAAFDYRYEVNLALWDRFFFSTLPDNADLQAFTQPGTLPNPNLHVVNDAGIDLENAPQNITAADQVARLLRLRNHHSVNSTSRLAWKALLMSNINMSDIAGRNVQSGTVPFPGSSVPAGEGGTPNSSVDPSAWQAFRNLSEAEIDALVDALIVEVKRRAPFISVSDFVNRRLYAGRARDASPPGLRYQRTDEDIASLAGPLDIAIMQAGLNSTMQDFRMEGGRRLITPFEGAPQHATVNVREERFANAPAHLTQGKILETIGSVLTARSDSFRVRAYGEARDSAGNITARAWCEATVQRSAEYFDSDQDAATTPTADLNSPVNQQYGRRFKVSSFRWLSEQEALNS